MNPSEVLEVVVFTVKDGEREPFLEKRGPALEALGRSFAGLMEARLAEYGDGTWIDVLRWESLDAAKAAADGIMELPEARDWSSHIAEVRDFRHASLHDVRDGAWS